MVRVDSLPSAGRLEESVINALDSRVKYFKDYRGFEVTEGSNAVLLTVRGAEFDSFSAQQPSKSRDGGIETRAGIEVLTEELSEVAAEIERDVQNQVESGAVDVRVRTSLNEVFSSVSGDEDVEFDLVFGVSS